METSSSSDVRDGSALGRLNSETQKLGNPQTSAQVNQRSLPILCYMSALLCEHGRFDDVRRDNLGKPRHFF
jgi:hypothetical protein